DYSSVFYTSTDDEFSVSGSLVFLDGQPAAGVFVKAEVGWDDGFSWVTKVYEQAADSQGQFNFTYPAYDLVLPNDTPVDIWLTYYFQDPQLYVELGSLYWDWTTETWTEYLY
ncbi:MAG: hypothetical protein JSV70_08760, partial [bacterium]